jgi:hypothetical protein
MTEVAELRYEIVTEVIAKLLSAVNDDDRTNLAHALAGVAETVHVTGACPHAGRQLRMAWRFVPWSFQDDHPVATSSLAVLVVQAANLCMDDLAPGNSGSVIADLTECATALRERGVSDLRMALMTSVSRDATVSDVEELLNAGRLIERTGQLSLSR